MNKTWLLAAATCVIFAGLTTAYAHMEGKGGNPMMQEYGGDDKQPGTYEEQHHQYMMYGYGMGPGMMGGYGMGPGMMGGYGMGPGMMGGYGMGPGTVGGYGLCPGPGTGRFTSPEEFNAFMDETKDLRKELHGLRFEYGEMMRNPKATREERKNLQKKMFELQQQIQEKAFE